MSLSSPRTLVALAGLMLGAACGDNLAPYQAKSYDLRAFGGRPLPTTTATQPPADSQFPGLVAGRIRFLSDSSLLYETRIEGVTLHPDGSYSFSGTGICQSSNAFRYHEEGDHYVVTALPAPQQPPVLPTLYKLGHGTLTGFVIRGDTIVQMHFLESEAEGSVCDGFGDDGV